MNLVFGLDKFLEFFALRRRNSEKKWAITSFMFKLGIYGR